MEIGERFFICTTKDNPEGFPYIREIYINHIARRDGVYFLSCLKTDDSIDVLVSVEYFNNKGVMKTEIEAVERYKELQLEYMHFYQDKILECERVIGCL